MHAQKHYIYSEYLLGSLQGNLSMTILIVLDRYFNISCITNDADGAVDAAPYYD